MLAEVATRIVSVMKGYMHTEAFVCPNSKCRRTFRTPLKRTDCLGFLRARLGIMDETYYSCPYCSSVIDKEKIHKFSIDDPEYGLAKILECPFYFGYLKKFPKSMSLIPDKCLTCPNLTQCSA